jgi:hypothetical protein
MSRQRFERRTVAVVAGLALLAVSATALAKELDQFSDRRWQLAYYAGGYRALKDAPGPAQIDRTLDAEMNRLLRELEEELNDAEPETELERVRCIQRVFQHPLLAELLTPYEEWLRLEAEVPLYRVRAKGIWGYAVDYDDLRLSWYIEASPVLQAAGVMLGIDKPGHFLAQGFQYYTRYRGLPQAWSETQKLAALRRYGHEMELGNLGVATTGVYSFADLAANWQGFLFHRALFEDVEHDGVKHAAYFRIDTEGRFRLTRPFHWAEWVTPDWDEALNPSHAQERRLYDKLVQNFWRRTGSGDATRPSVCEDYLSDPQGYLGSTRLLWPRSRYAELRGDGSAMGHPIDVRRICARRPALRGPSAGP